MGDELQLINTALSHLGQEKLVADLAEDPPSRPLRVAQALLPTARDALLTKHPWLCAIRRYTLTALERPDAADWKYQYAYLLPVDELRLWVVGTDYEYQKGVVDRLDAGGAVIDRKKALLTDAPGPLKVELLERIPVAEMSAGLFDALAYELAARMAGPLQADKSLGRALRQDAVAAMTEAVTAEVTDFGNQEPEFQSRWLGVRS